MMVRNISEFTGGWFIGNFEPSVHKTKDFEVCYKTHRVGEMWPVHYHKGIEINYLIRGKMTIGEKTLLEGDVFTIEPNEVANPIFLIDCELIVVKIPSDPGDKYFV